MSKYGVIIGTRSVWTPGLVIGLALLMFGCGNGAQREKRLAEIEGRLSTVEQQLDGRTKELADVQVKVTDLQGKLDVSDKRSAELVPRLDAAEQCLTPLVAFIKNGASNGLSSPTKRRCARWWSDKLQ